MYRRSLILLCGLLANACTAAVVPVLSERQSPAPSRPLIARITEFLGKGGRVDRPADAAPEREALQSNSTIKGIKRVKVRYGPYSIPGAETKSLMGEAGMLWNYPDISVAKPCEECVLLSQQAGLEYLNGTNANIDTGLWLHHMVHFVAGPNRWDPTCYGHISLPHFNIKSRPEQSERWFSSGNERTLVPLNLKEEETKWGYHVTKNDTFSFIIDLMNMNKQAKVVFMTMTYEYLDGPLPEGWKDVKPVWLDVNQCGTSEIASPQKKQFSISSRPWTPNFNGRLLSTGAHVHDGGVDVRIMRSSEQICDAKTAYAETPEYITGPGLMNMGSGGEGGHSHGGNMKHISSMTSCTVAKQSDKENEAITTDIEVSPAQQWSIKASYDYDRYQGEQNEGKYEDIMGISLMFVAVEPGVQPIGPSDAVTRYEVASSVFGTIGALIANAVGLGWLV